MTMSALSGSNGTSAVAPYVLPSRLEQLVGDCFDEEQYATGLATLSSLVGPNVFPSHHLVQQLLVLCISSPNAATAASTGLISKKRKRLNATAFSQIVIDAATIADVNAFLHRWLLTSPTSSSFASHLLAALPPFDHTDEDADETIVARRRVRRSSHSSGASEEQGSPIVEAVGEVVKDADNVWGMLASAAAAPTTPQKSDKRRRKGSDTAAVGKWNLPYDGQEDVEWSREDADTSMAKLLTCLVQERDDNLSLVDEQFDSWRDLLDPMAPYDCEGAWRLLAILVVAWKRQRQQVAAAAGGSKSASTLYDKLHLLRQIVSRPDVRKSYEDLATPLDVVFAGLTCLDHWKPWYSSSSSEPSRNPAYAHAKAAAQHRHAETAAWLLVELCHLASLGVISADALARGIFERLSFVGLPQIQALNAAFEQDHRESMSARSQSSATSPKSILCDAYVRHLDIEAALEKGEKKDKRAAPGSHGRPLLEDEDLREVFDEDDTLCMREVAGRALREHGSQEASSRAGRGSVEDEEEALEDEASLRLRLTACASSRASASVSPTISKKCGSNTQRRPSKEPSDDGRSGNDEDDAERSQKLLEKALAAASQALASLRRWEILAFVEKAYRYSAMSDTSSSSTAKRLSSAGLQPTRLSAAFETTVQDVARDALDVLQEQHRRRRRSHPSAYGGRHSRRGSSVSNASVSTAASGHSRAFSKTPSPLPESVAPGGTAGPSTANQQSVRPKSGRTSKPPPRMGISRRSRGLSSSTARSTATPAALGQGQQQQATVSPITDADDDEEDEEDEEMKIARKRVREAEAREDWLLRVLLRETVARLETLRGRMGAVQMGVGTGGGGTRTGGS